MMKTLASTSFNFKWRQDIGSDCYQNNGRGILEMDGMSTGEQQEKTSVRLEALVGGRHLSQGVFGERVWRHESISHLNVSTYCLHHHDRHHLHN